MRCVERNRKDMGSRREEKGKWNGKRGRVGKIRAWLLIFPGDEWEI